MDWPLIFIVAILFFATWIRSAFGFGEALIAVPLLALVIPVEVAAPVAVLVSITVALMVLVQDWGHVHLRSVARLVIPTVIGTPLGLLLLFVATGQIVKTLLAVVIISFSTYSLLSWRPVKLEDDRWAWAFGFGAGILGGAYGMNGPPLVVYGALRDWSPQDFRATLQGYFLPASILTAVGYWFADLWTSTVTYYYLLALPVVVLAVFLGRAVNKRLSGRSFIVYVHIGLIVVGALLLSQVFA